MSDAPVDGGPAFLIPAVLRDDGVILESQIPGMTMRQYYAAHAPSPPNAIWVGIAKDNSTESLAFGLAAWARTYADAMIKEMEA